MYCIVLQREVDTRGCDQCWGYEEPGIGSDMHRECQTENLRADPPARVQVQACLFPTIQLDRLCEGCPVASRCDLPCKGVDLMYGPRARRKGA